MPHDESRMRQHREAMARGEPVPVTLTTHEEKQAPGVIRLVRLTPRERDARARKWLLICLAIAPVSLVCPPHFPWPILAITIGFVGAYLRRGRPELVAGGEARCPACDAFQILDAGNAEFPMAHFCTECRERSLVRPTDPGVVSAGRGGRTAGPSPG
jgi:hypothetical protein